MPMAIMGMQKRSVNALCEIAVITSGIVMLMDSREIGLSVVRVRSRGGSR